MAKNQVSATLSPEKYAALEEYRWTKRVNKISEVVALAVDKFIESEGIVVAPAADEAPEAPAEETTKRK